MTSRNVKSTWELAGRLSGSFSESTKRAQTQLSQLRREYRQNQGELRRMQSVMRTAAQGTDAYSNAQRRIPQLQDDLNSQAFAIGAVEKEALGGARAQERLSGATGRAGAGLKSLATFGIAAGAGIGIAAGAVAGLTKALNSTGRQAQQLQGAVHPGDRHSVVPTGRQPAPDPERRCGHRQAGDTVGGRRLPVLRPAPGLQPQFLPR